MALLAAALTLAGRSGAMGAPFPRATASQIDHGRHRLWHSFGRTEPRLRRDAYRQLRARRIGDVRYVCRRGRVEESQHRAPLDPAAELRADGADRCRAIS